MYNICEIAAIYLLMLGYAAGFLAIVGVLYKGLELFAKVTYKIHKKRMLKNK